MKYFLALLVGLANVMSAMRAQETADSGGKARHWSFQPVVRPEAPLVNETVGVRNPIDRFILARLEKEGIKPSAEADRITLIRRVYLDLIGLLPSIAEVDSFLIDDQPDAYERVVDRLLASPHYGERWGRHWLDQARYADSNGFNIDAPRSIWKYRDWVIESLDRDMPFDQFTIEQLAGDLQPHATVSQRVATGFHRNTLINQEGGIDLEQFRVEAVVDRVNTTGAVFLGLTIGCAQCHDHKYDPLSQREYYRLFAFLNNADEPDLELPEPGQLETRAAVRKKLAELQQQLKSYDGATPELLLAWEKQLTDEAKKTLPADIQSILKLPDNGRTKEQELALDNFYRRSGRTLYIIEDFGAALPFARLAGARALQNRLTIEQQVQEWKNREPKIVTTMVMKERPTPRESFIHLGGDFLRKGELVTPGTPAVLPSLECGRGQPNRLDLARWIVDPRNPLTRRVLVNRMWQAYFGVGLVETDNDFGIQGTPPSHPELLDWLAAEFLERKWSMKAMHRLIVTSATYRQSSRSRPELATVDPRNRLLARQSRMRLEAEVVRDVALCSSGVFCPRIGGPGVFPPQPEGLYRFTQIPRDWKPSTGADRFRRGIYTWFWRSAPYPALTVFDAPDSTTACTRRNRSNTPLQALTMLNDQASIEFAQALAARLLTAGCKDESERIRLAWRLCLCRDPKESERTRLQRLLDVLTDDLRTQPDQVTALLTATPPDGIDRWRFAAWLTVARVLLNLDEFVTRE
jgi:hypothetical protein